MRALILSISSLLIGHSQVSSLASDKAFSSPRKIDTSLHQSSSSQQPLENQNKMTSAIRNFRQAAGLENVYRCGSTDELGEKLELEETLTSHDLFVFEQVGLVLDLRSPTERKTQWAQKWIEAAGMKTFESDHDYVDTPGKRCVVRIDVLNPPRFMEYVSDNWFSPTNKAKALWFKLFDGDKLHELRIDALNERGLGGLNEAILESGKAELFRALVTITSHIENNPSQLVVIHCVQGKDRTGILSMLLQSLLDVPDDKIIADYFLSNEMLKGKDKEGSAAASDAANDAFIKRGRLDRKFFTGTNEEAMVEALAFLRSKYGSVVPGYFDEIGFDAAWRERLLAVLKKASDPPASRF